MLWLGVDPDTSTWAVIVSVVWKVLGFGMILFVAAIQAMPQEINEAARVDGATAWQRTTRVTVPLTMRTILLVTLVSVIGSLLAFDQFYLMTAGQPTNQTATSVFYVYLNSFPFLKLGYGAALSLILAFFILLFTVDPDDPDAAESLMTGVGDAGRRRRRRRPVGAAPPAAAAGRGRGCGPDGGATSTGAVCVAVCTVMLLPLLASVLASVKPTAEAAQTPPTYVPHGFSLDAYRRLWEYQSGLPTYLFNSFGTAVLTVLFTLVLTTLAGYGLARFPVPFKEPLFVVLLLALIIPYQALLTPIFLMFSDLGLTNSLVGLAIIHTAIQLPFSLYIMRNSFEAVPA